MATLSNNFTDIERPVPPAEFLIISCGRYPELPVTVKTNKKKRVGIRLFVNYIIIRELIGNFRVLFDPYIHKILSHVIYPRTSMYTKRYDC